MDAHTCADGSHSRGRYTSKASTYGADQSWHEIYKGCNERGVHSTWNRVSRVSLASLCMYGMCACSPHSAGPTISASATVSTRSPRARAALRAGGPEGCKVERAMRNARVASSLSSERRASEGPWLWVQ